MPANWFDGATVTVEAALSAATGTYGAWDVGAWDSATWGPGAIWTDISHWARSIRIDRKFGRDVQGWDAGTASIVLDNRDGRFSPDNLSGPYVTAGVTEVRPARPLRVRATYGGVTYDLFTGYAVDWLESWRGGGVRRGDALVMVPCEDEWAVLAAFDGQAVPAVGAGETTGRRVHRILDSAGHTGNRSIAVGRNTVQATTLASNASTELKLVVDSEGGGLFVDSDGTIVFEDQYALIESARSNSIQATFGDGAGELPYSSPQMAYDGRLIRNIAAFTRVGGTAQVAADATSRALYRDRKESRADLVAETDAQALALATFFVERFKAPERRITSIAVFPRRSPSTLYPQALGRRVRDLVRVKRQPPGSHTITRDCHIAGIHHFIDKSKGHWETTFDLWSATVYQTYSTSRWDVGSWDSAAWFF